MSSLPSFDELMREWIAYFHKIACVPQVVKEAVSEHGIQLSERDCRNMDAVMQGYVAANVKTKAKKVYEEFVQYMLKKEQGVARKHEAGQTEEQIRARVFQFSFDPETDLSQYIQQHLVEQIDKYEQETATIKARTAEMIRRINKLAELMGLPAEEEAKGEDEAMEEENETS
uniref:Pre-rRNA-processing protein TSR2 homolog n=1 Tax=Steinernema glaseri TaxID=37863 RepID=A0A1I7YF95_9BILA